MRQNRWYLAAFVVALVFCPMKTDAANYQTPHLAGIWCEPVASPNIASGKAGYWCNSADGRPYFRLAGGTDIGASGAGWTRTAVADTGVTAAPTGGTSVLIAYTSITAARTVTGTTAGSATTPAFLRIVDESGVASQTNKVHFAPSSGTIDGAASKDLITNAGGWWQGYCNGTNWFTLASSEIGATVGVTTDAVFNIGDATHRVSTAFSVNHSSQHFTGAQAAVPTYAAGTGAGTSPTTFAIVGSDSAMLVKLTTGTTPTASATILTVTLNAAFAATPHCHMQPANVNAALLNSTSNAYIDQASGSSSTIVMKSGSVGLTAATAYWWEVICVG